MLDYYSFTDPVRDGRLSWPGWLTIADILPTKWSHVNHKSGVDL